MEHLALSVFTPKFGVFARKQSATCDGNLFGYARFVPSSTAILVALVLVLLIILVKILKKREKVGILVVSMEMRIAGGEFWTLKSVRIRLPIEINFDQTMPYTFAIFYCHYQESESKVFKVSLGGENGDTADAVAVYHPDTSQWSPDHVSFRVLGIKPQSKPVCHFSPADNLGWIALPVAFI